MRISSPSSRKMLVLLTASCIAISANAAELLYFFDPDCGACKAFDEKVGYIYDKTDEAALLPMKKVNIDGLSADEITAHVSERAHLRSDIVGTPTFVVIDKGREIDRFSGFSSDELFWMSLQRMLNQL